LVHIYLLCTVRVYSDITVPERLPFGPLRPPRSDRVAFVAFGRRVLHFYNIIYRNEDHGVRRGKSSYRRLKIYQHFIGGRTVPADLLTPDVNSHINHNTKCDGVILRKTFDGIGGGQIVRQTRPSTREY